MIYDSCRDVLEYALGMIISKHMHCCRDCHELNDLRGAVVVNEKTFPLCCEIEHQLTLTQTWKAMVR